MRYRARHNASTLERFQVQYIWGSALDAVFRPKNSLNKLCRAPSVRPLTNPSGLHQLSSRDDAEALSEAFLQGVVV